MSWFERWERAAYAFRPWLEVITFVVVLGLVGGALGEPVQ